MYDLLSREELIERLQTKDKRWKDMIVREHELTVALEQATVQNDVYNHMIADLLKERRERNWLYQGVENSQTAT